MGDNTNVGYLMSSLELPDASLARPGGSCAFPEAVTCMVQDCGHLVKSRDSLKTPLHPCLFIPKLTLKIY